MIRAVVMSAMLAVGLGVFTTLMLPRVRLLLAARRADRLGDWGARLLQTARVALFQAKMPRDLVAGVAHIFIYGGFMVLALRTITLFVRAYVPGFDLPGQLGQVYNATKDVIWLLVFLGVGYSLARRLGPWQTRVGRSWEGVFVLCMIGALGLTDVVYDGAHFAAAQPPWWTSPLGFAFYRGFGGAPADLMHLLGQVAYWAHCALILVFLNFLPLGKHFHVLTSFPNVFFGSLKPRGWLAPIDLETAEKYGIATLADLTWSQVLNTYSCTECGRCNVYCPTHLTGKPLSHRQLNLDLKAGLLANQAALLAARPDAPAELPPVVSEAGPITSDTIWACTTCLSCEQECPVLIEQVQRIVELRQHKVLMEGDVAPELARAFKGMEQNYNPWGLGYDQRADWAAGLDVPTMAAWAEAHPGADAPLLFWVGCAGSYDDRIKKVSVAMVKLLRAAKVEFAILGTEEACTGDAARRAGNEYLFQTLARQNIETLDRYRVKRILTICPHCFHTLGTDYVDLGGRYEVVHHTTFIRRLLDEGALRLTTPVGQGFRYHDSCYLGRYHDLYRDPRAVLEAVPGLTLAEFPRHESRGVCCGAGGARFWLEEKIGQRINHNRVEEALAAGATNLAAACPFCLTMLGDGLKDKGHTDDLVTLDIAEIVARAL